MPWRPKSLGLSLDMQGSLFPSWKWLLWKITQNRGGQDPGWGWESPNHICSLNGPA